VGADAAGERILQREEHRVVTLEGDGRTVRKTFLGADTGEQLEQARREHDRLTRFSRALAGVDGARCPEPVELSAGPYPSVRMTRAEGLALSVGREGPVEMAWLTRVLCDGLTAYIATFSEAYYDFHFRNMLYDPTGREVTFLDFGVPDHLVAARPALDRLSPLDASLGNLYGSTLFEAVRPRNLRRREQSRRLLALSTAVIESFRERGRTDPAVRPTPAGVAEATEIVYRESASWGPRTHHAWYRLFPRRLSGGKRRLERLFGDPLPG
jgi:hypothetical protein